MVELKDGRLMMLSRTDQGSQFRSYSSDGGITWSPAEPSNIISPVSPCSIERMPSTGDLVLVWNDHSDVADAYRGKRTPLHVAISRDEARPGSSARPLRTIRRGGTATRPSISRRTRCCWATAPGTRKWGT